MKFYTPLVQLFLRIALAVGFIVPGLDRFGVWGPNGTNGVTWGNWQQFSIYAQQLMFFLPSGLANFMAILASIAELTFGVLLILGLYLKWVSLGSGILTLCFAFCMMLAFGIHAPLNYSVFTVSAAAFLLANVSNYQWSLDKLIKNRKINRRTLKYNLYKNLTIH